MSTYPIQAAIRARQHRASGWGPTRICELLAEEGFGSPSLSTVKTWVLPNYAEAHRQQDRRRKRSVSAGRASFRLPSSTPEYQRAFMLALRVRGTSCASIARVCQVVFGATHTAEAVRAILHDEVVPSEPEPEAPQPSATPILDRMIALRGAGLSATHIAAVIALDQKVVMTAHQVRYALRTMREPRHAIRRSRERAT